MEFRYKLGDLVCGRNSVRMSLDCDGSTIPKVGTIITRWTQECPGGTQLHYDVRWESPTGAQTSKFLLEMELELYEPEMFSKIVSRSVEFLTKHRELLRAAER